VKHVVFLALLATSACTAPTLQQRQANWRAYQDSVKATCNLGKVDPARPGDVADWCDKLTP